MRILLATESYWPNHDGGAIVEHSLVRYLTTKGHDVWVIAPSVSGKANIEHHKGSIIYRLSSMRFLFHRGYRVSIWPFRQIKYIICEFEPDVIHIHNTWFIGIATLRYARKKKIPVVATNHFMPENSLYNLNHALRIIPFFEFFINFLGWKFLVWFHNKVDVVTSPTQTAIDLLVTHGLTAPHQAVSNGVDIHRFSLLSQADAITFQKNKLSQEMLKKKFNLPRRCFLILYVGRLDGEKRLDILIHASELLFKESNPSSAQPHVALVGKGRKKYDLQKQVSKLGIKKHVSFLGALSDKDLPDIYRAADCFAIPSPSELQSIVTLEAMATGLPIVAADVAALPELVHNGENGYLFTFPHADSMADKFRKIMNHKQRARQFGKKSREIAKQHHRANSHHAIENLYQHICNKSKVNSQ